MKTFSVKSNGKTYNVKAKDAQHAAKLVKLLQKDARRINYDDDIIKVTLNGKEVYKGMAEDWVDDDFYKNFKWTGSQYEASNAKGKWVVKVLDSKTTTKDAASAREVIQQLIDDEASATAAYNIAIKNLTGELDEQSIAVLRAIRDDEERHSENLFAIMSGNVTEKNLQDSTVKDFERKDFNDVRVVERSGQVSIGWASLGAVSIAEAESFMRDLQKAINYAKTQR